MMLVLNPPIFSILSVFYDQNSVIILTILYTCNRRSYAHTLAHTGHGRCKCIEISGQAKASIIMVHACD